MVNTNIKELSMKFHYNQKTFLFITNIFAKKAMGVILNELSRLFYEITKAPYYRKIPVIPGIIQLRKDILVGL